MQRGKINSDSEIHLPFHGFEKEFLQERPSSTPLGSRLWVSSKREDLPLWSQVTWRNPEVLAFSSISEAAELLRSQGRNWVLFEKDTASLRRAEHIRKKLPYCSFKRLCFPSPPPSSPLGAWILLDDHHLLLSSQTSSPLPEGRWEFEEDKIHPPSRAYLKLWELFSRYPSLRLAPEARVLELGASPGSWTWALLSLECRVCAVDRSPLAPFLLENPLLTFEKRDAFSLSPKDFPQSVEWIFSDVICYPEKLWEWLQPWLAQEAPLGIVATLKLQEGYHQKTLEAFKKVPGSFLLHLYHNKHELTWFRPLQP